MSNEDSFKFMENNLLNEGINRSDALSDFTKLNKQNL